MSACSSVVTIAQQLSHASAEQSPLILLALNSVLEREEWSAKEKQSARRQIWRCDLLHIIVEVLRQEFALVPGQWGTAAKLATLLTNVCVGLKPKVLEQQSVSGENADQVTEYYEILLPTAVDSLLILANNLMELATAHVAKGDLRPHFLTVADALTWLCSYHQQHCIQRALQSPYLLNILISDEVVYSGIALKFMAKMLEECPGVFSLLPSETMQSVLDELVYKISSADDQSALPALDLLGAFVHYSVTLLDTLLLAYKGLSVVISKWNTHRLGPNAAQLVAALEARVACDQEAARKDSAAVLIQATWKGYISRKKMKRVQRGIRRFQKMYRKWKLDKEKAKQGRTQVTSRPVHTAQREFHERQIATLRLLPACEVGAFVKRQEGHAASTIQAWWRGFVARKVFQKRKVAAIRTQSASVIQRAVRRYLHGRRKEWASTEDMYPKLTCAERDLLLREVQRMREGPPSTQSSDQRRQLHDQVQQLLVDFYANLRSVRHRDEQRHVLLAQLMEDSNQVLSAPPLCHASDELVELFTSGSRVVACMAEMAHREELKAMQLPWWKKSSVEEDSIMTLLS